MFASWEKKLEYNRSRSVGDLQGCRVGECRTTIGGKEWNFDSFGCGRVGGDQFERQGALGNAGWASKVAKSLGEGCAGETVARDDGVDADTVVKIVARDCACDVIDIVKRVLVFDLEYLGTGKTFPIEANGIKVTSEGWADLRDEVYQVEGHIDAILAIFLDDNDGSRKEILEESIAVGEPTWEGGLRRE